MSRELMRDRNTVQAGDSPGAMTCNLCIARAWQSGRAVFMFSCDEADTDIGGLSVVIAQTPLPIRLI